MESRVDSSLAANMEANHASPSPHLPVELLAYAFVLGLPPISFDSPRDVLKYQVLVSSVCASWREIAHHTSALWVPLAIHRLRPTASEDSQDLHQKMQEDSARRSGRRELELFIECIDGPKRELGLNSRTLTFLATIIPRARVLSVKTDGRCTFKTLFPLASAPRLQRLQIRGIEQRRAPPPLVLFGPSADAPLELFDFTDPIVTDLAQVHHIPAARLKCFVADSACARVEEYGTFLSRCTYLEMLKLRHCDAEMARVALPPSLKVLELQYRFLPLPSPPFMPAPNLVHLTIRRTGLDRGDPRWNRNEGPPEWPPMPLLESLSINAPRSFRGAMLALIKGAPNLTAVEVNASLADSGRDYNEPAEEFKTLVTCPTLRLLRIVASYDYDEEPPAKFTQEFFEDALNSRVPAKLKIELWHKPAEVSLAAVHWEALKKRLRYRVAGSLAPNNFPKPPLREVVSGGAFALGA